MTPSLQNRFEQLKCCVLIPTYNNEQSLREVVESVLQFTSNVIVVNDGSTDSTNDILKQFESITVVSYSPNRGKGHALRTGFRKAVEMGYSYAIAMDSDGQHKAADLVRFLNKIETTPGSLIIGARNMEQENVPGGSSFGYKFSNFWFHLETGIKAPDTQSGYRLYPVSELSRFWFFTTKYEFEIEVIVRAAWAGIPIEHVPIDVYYPPREERITHFRKIPDFTRISLLNSVLVILAFTIFRPLMFLRSLTRANTKEWIRRNVLSSSDSNIKIANTVALGTFMGLSPYHGIKLVVVIFLGVLFRMNKPLLIGVSYIGMPPLIPFIIFFSQEVGGWLLNRPNVLKFSTHMELTVEFVWRNLMQQMLGGTVFALAGALLFWLATFLMLLGIGRKDPATAVG